MIAMSFMFDTARLDSLHLSNNSTCALSPVCAETFNMAVCLWIVNASATRCLLQIGSR